MHLIGFFLSKRSLLKKSQFLQISQHTAEAKLSGLKRWGKLGLSQKPFQHETLIFHGLIQKVEQVKQAASLSLYLCLSLIPRELLLGFVSQLWITRVSITFLEKLPHLVLSSEFYCSNCSVPLNRRLDPSVGVTFRLLCVIAPQSLHAVQDTHTHTHMLRVTLCFCRVYLTSK